MKSCRPRGNTLKGASKAVAVHRACTNLCTSTGRSQNVEESCRNPIEESKTIEIIWKTSDLRLRLSVEFLVDAAGDDRQGQAIVHAVEPARKMRVKLCDVLKDIKRIEKN